MAVCSSSSCLSRFLSNPSTEKRNIRKGTLKATLNPDTRNECNRNGLLNLNIRSGTGSTGFCPCCNRRHFIGAVLGTGLFPIFPSSASPENFSSEDPIAMLNMMHPPRPGWYEEFYASAMDKMMESYETAIAGYKSQLFAKLKGKAEKVLEIGVGTGPNFRYYAESPGISVIGVDPNNKMKRYALSAAEIAGMEPSNFKFIQAVAEALPLSDASVDAVVGTLVLCSVKDVDRALHEVTRVLKPGGLYIFIEHVAAKDATTLRVVQEILDPLQQILADGCHLTRNTASNIAEAGFSRVDANQAYLSNFSLISPHVHGVAYR